MNSFFIKRVGVHLCLLLSAPAFCETTPQKQLNIKRINTTIKIDGVLDEPAWKDAPEANRFVALRPTPFKAENSDNATQIYFLYSNEGIYIGGYLHEKNKDSIAAELAGRDGFGNNDFIGVIFDTYNDKLNGFEYFVTPLGEQMDAKIAPNNNGNNEDFSWNAVWQSAAKIQKDGWTFEMFLPYSSIRFGNKKVQDWGLNIVRRRQKSGEQLFWQAIDPNVNGFLTQEGLLKGIEDIKPPLRLEFSPYFSTYFNHDGTLTNSDGKNKTSFSGGMDVKYGINQAFTLDMTLVPDFGQVQSDNRVLNLSPFEQKFSENRSFFTEGTDLFNKGNLFYSRRIGGQPLHYYDVNNQLGSTETIVSNPVQSKLINATKISGRTQNGLGIGLLNAITQPTYAYIRDNTKQQERKVETDPLTNYNVLVFDQTLKHNSSISLVNTNVIRSGTDYDANVNAFLFDLNDKSNTWNLGGSIGTSALFNKNNKNSIGYTHSLYFGKTSGRFNFTLWQELSNDKYDKSDLGYFTNNNTMDQGVWAGYNWTKPKNWYNQLRVNANLNYSRLVSPLDILHRPSMMYQNAGGNFNANAQTKKLWWIGLNLNFGLNYNDFYESRVTGRVFQNKGRIGINGMWNSNQARVLSWGGNFSTGTGGVFNRKSLTGSLFGKIRFSSKFSIDHNISVESHKNQPGWAYTGSSGIGPTGDTILFSRRNLITTENVLNLKYNFTNRMGITCRVRHYWSKVQPVQIYQLDTYGKLQTPDIPFTGNVNQNYNYLSVDMVYNWQFAQGSFFNIVWKDIGESFNRDFEKNYINNLGKTINGPQFNSLSVRVIYFLDYLSVKNSRKSKI